MQSSLHMPMSFPLSASIQMPEKMHKKDFFRKITQNLQIDKLQLPQTTQHYPTHQYQTQPFGSPGAGNQDFGLLEAVI